jgi:hypothetical protein
MMLQQDKAYLNALLKKYFIKKDSSNIIINLPISIDSKFYNNKDVFKLLMELILGYAKHGVEYVDPKNDEEKVFKASEIQFDVGDVLNRHNIYFWDINEYMLKNNVSNYSKISEDIKSKFREKAYNKGAEQGLDWFKNNISAINILMPEDKKICDSYTIEKSEVILYEGSENFPKITYIPYSYWLNHKKYNQVSESLKEVCGLDGSRIENVFRVEAEYFYEKLIKNNDVKIVDREFFVENAKEYLKDEAVAFITLYNGNNNVIEFYLGWENNFSMAFRGKRMRNDEVVQKYLRNELKGADQRKFVSVKMTEDTDSPDSSESIAS